MEEALNLYINYLKEIKGAADNTIESYKRDLLRFFLYLEEYRISSFSQINETCLNSYVLKLERDKLSPATVSRSISSIKVFFLFLLKQGIIKEDTTERIRPPKVKKKQPEIISVEEVDRLLSQPDPSTKKGIRDKAMLELLYATGIRVSELINLTYKDVNCQSGFIICKNAKKERIIPFGKKAKQALLKYIEDTKDAGERDNSDCLFLNRMGQALTRQGFWKLMKSYARMAGITKELTPHMLRHSFAAHMIENGADIKAVQELLGHSDVSVTQVYIQSGNKKVREVYMESHPRA